ncbi:MAG: MgtC/SapB family protein [Longilinea sp.]|nr:MgtC/SapB family protein [Longilinea sp.]MCA1954801.1 MgtC/SapB family protein [Anaerolinea sp.]
MIPEFEIVLRLLVASALGLVIGLERERQGQPAGLRTHVVLVIGSTLAMTISINLAMQFRPLVPNGDPARLAAQVVSGIGFLGAGAILHYGASVKGLTTAASLWTMAMVGLAVGAGHYLPAIATTLLLLIVLTILNVIEKRLIHTYVILTISVITDYRPGIEQELQILAQQFGGRVHSVIVENNLLKGKSKTDLVIKVRDDPRFFADFGAALNQIAGVRSYRIS